MIKLHHFPPVFGRNLSPFTLKLEGWLRLARPYEVAPTRNPGRGPKAKLPFIVDDDGTVVADSSFTIEHLVRTRGIGRGTSSPAGVGSAAGADPRGCSAPAFDLMG